jgi:homoserine dehydrogenase
MSTELPKAPGSSVGAEQTADLRRVRIALLGCGTVGAEVVRLLHQQAADLTARVGAPLEIVGIAVRRPGRDRGDLPVDPALFTTDALGLVKREDVDVLV